MGLPQTTDDACYRAMDWLLQIREQLEKQVFDRASELLGLEVGPAVLRHDQHVLRDGEEADAQSPATSGTIPASPAGAEGAAGATETGFRTWGKSKDYRDDLPQVVIGMAVTRDGIPLRVWCAGRGTPPTRR